MWQLSFNLVPINKKYCALLFLLTSTGLAQVSSTPSAGAVSLASDGKATSGWAVTRLELCQQRPIVRTRAGWSQCSADSALQRSLEVDAITPSSPGSNLLRRGASNPCRPARATQSSL
jgi:hypothetical protein